MLTSSADRMFHRLARLALANYDLHTVRLKLLAKTEHVVFRVDAAVGAGRVERFVLRFYNPAVFDTASVQTEVEWLAALVHEAGVAVPEPIHSRDGSVLVYTPLNIGLMHPSVLFRWVAGRRRKASLTPAALERVGYFVAQLHHHAEQFRPSVGTTGQHWDWERVFSDTSIRGSNLAHARFSLDQQALLTMIANATRAAMEQLGRSPHVWGLIHADLHTSNYLFTRSSVGAIDFEDCGWGYYVYDLAVILDEIYAAYPAHATVFRSALIHGYCQFRPLNSVQLSCINTFIAMRLAELIRWYGSSDNPTHHAVAQQVMAEATSFVQQHLPAQ